MMRGEWPAILLLVGLTLLYLLGFLLGWAARAPWHLLLVLVAIVGLYVLFTRRARSP